MLDQLIITPTLEVADGIRLQEANLLGITVMTEVRDAISIDGGELLARWAEAGLDPNLCPTPRHPNDAFRRSTSSLPDPQGYHFLPYKGSALPEDVRLASVLVRTTPAKGRVAHTHQNRASLYLGTDDEIRLEVVGALDRAEQNRIDQARLDYDRLRTQVDGPLVRASVMHLLKRSHGFPLRDGVVIVPDAYRRTVQGVVRLLRTLNDYTPPGTKPNKTIVIDYHRSPEQTDQLIDALDEHIGRTVDALIRSFHAYQAEREKAGKSVGHEKIATIEGELLALNDLVGAFEQSLGLPLPTIRRLLDPGRVFA